ncbi:MAG: hypothetical protein IPG06_17185 [Haliea sp.]|nr:hypothetical protein [Haliea sp.]
MIEKRSSKDTRSSSVAIFGMIFAISVASCASLNLPQPPEKAVAARAQANGRIRWVGTLKRHFISCSALREASSMQRYGSKYAGVVNWKEAKVETVACEPERCDVKSSVRYEMIRPRVENTRFFEEVWIEVAGVWYIYDS